MTGARHEMGGVIASAGFASGDRLVVGHWTTSPIGPFTDVMWGRPDGSTVLLSPDARAETFITAVYTFDHTEIVPIAARGDGHGIELTAGAVTLGIVAGRAVLRLPRRRPAWSTRWIEDPVARVTMGVRTYGTSPTGVREWYRADAYRPARSAHATIDGAPLGPMGPLEPQLGVGFTDPPARPSIVEVRPLLHDPSGRLDAVLSPGRTR